MIAPRSLLRLCQCLCKVTKGPNSTCSYSSLLNLPFTGHLSVPDRNLDYHTLVLVRQQQATPRHQSRRHCACVPSFSPNPSPNFHNIKTNSSTMNGEIVPEGYWMCCSCNSPNIVELAESKCPACGHDKGNCCAQPGDPKPIPESCYTMSFPSAQATDPYSRSQPHSPDYSRCCRPNADDSYHIQSSDWGTRYPNATLPGATQHPDGTDVWNCCGCSANNLTANSPDRCPVCSHYRCGYCTVGHA